METVPAPKNQSDLLEAVGAGRAGQPNDGSQGPGSQGREKCRTNRLEKRQFWALDSPET